MKRLALAVAAAAATLALSPAAALAAAPTASTGAATDVTPTAATVSGVVNLQGGTYSRLLNRCEVDYGTTTSYGSSVACPTQPTSGSSSNTAENFALTGLRGGTEYHYAVVVSNGLLTSPAMGSDATFTTPTAGTPPAVGTSAATNVGGNAATVHGTLRSNNWSILGCAFTYTAAGGSAQSAPCVSGSGDAISADPKNLVQGTAYTYAIKVAYGSSASPQTTTSSAGGSFTTTEAAIGPAARITSSSATMQGSVNPEGQAVTACTYYYGPSFATLRTAPCSVAPGAITGTSPTLVTGAATGLSPKTLYLQAVILTTSGGTAVSSLSTFTTPVAAPAPTASVSAATGISATAATLHGRVDARGQGVEGCEFVYSVENLASAAGQGTGVACHATSSASGQSVSVTLGHLTAHRRYYYQLTFLTYGGLVRSNVRSFVTPRGDLPAATIRRVAVDAHAHSARFSFSQRGRIRVTRGYSCALAAVRHGRTGRLVYRSCRSPRTVTRLRPGTYVFSVRGANSSGAGAAVDRRFRI